MGSNSIFNASDMTKTTLTGTAEFASLLENLDVIYNTTELNFSEAAMNHYCHTPETNATRLITSNDSEVVRHTVMIYVPMYVISFFLFCLVRKHFPRYFNIRSWVPELKCDIALKEYRGYFSWVREVYKVSDDEMLEQCGMDSLCVVRILRFCRKMSLFGCFHAIYLLPLYGTAKASASDINDPLRMATVGNVPNGNSPIFIATVIATYCINVYTMYNLVKEFEWFTEYRHKFLIQRLPRNYTVYVTGIPEEIRTSEKLNQYFEDASSDLCVLEALITYETPKLDGLTSRREALVNIIDHVCAYERINAKEMSLMKLRQLGLGLRMPLVDSVEAFEIELRQLNLEISSRIDLILNPNNACNELQEQKEISEQILNEISNASERQGRESSSRLSIALSAKLLWPFRKTIAKTGERVGTALITKAKDGIVEGQHVAMELGTTVLGTASAVTNIRFLFEQTGKPRKAGFVVFKTLFDTQAALQMIHHHSPHILQVTAAPDPEDVVWKNVGSTRKAQRLGSTLSAAATVALCIFWTPVNTSLTLFTSVGNLKKQIPSLEEKLDTNPNIERGLEQLGPLLLVVTRGVLIPFILSYFVRWEGLISTSGREASLFVKLSVFLIIQYFFVIALSGSFADISAHLWETVKNPTGIITQLSDSLPAQSSIFIQMIVIEASLVQAMELLRFTPLLYAFVRPHVGRNLTEKDRKSKFLFFHALENPPLFYASRRLAQLTLFFMVFFVYSAIAPIVNFFLLVSCAIIESGYRYNFYRNLHSKPDSGGRYFEQFIRLIMFSMILAQLILLGLLSLKGFFAFLPCMLPLIIGSIYFIWLLNLRHFRIANNLPTHSCLQTVRKNLQAVKDGELDINFATGKYLQPSLQHRMLYPTEGNRHSESEVIPTEGNQHSELGVIPDSNAEDSTTFLELGFIPESHVPERDNSPVNIDVSEMIDDPKSSNIHGR